MKTRKFSREKVRHFSLDSLEPRHLLTADLIGAFVTPLPAAIPPAGATTVKLKVTNQGDLLAKGAATIKLYASADQTLDPNDILLSTTTKSLNLAASKNTSIPLKFTPSSAIPSGQLYLLADIQTDASITESTPANNLAVSPSTLLFTHPFVDLSVQITKIPLKTVKFSKGQGTASFTAVITNHGNLPIKGPINVRFLLSPDATLDPADPLIFSGPQTINIAPNKTATFTLNAKLGPNTPSGTLFVFADINTAHALGETLFDDNTAHSLATFTVNNPAVPAGPFILGNLTSDASVVLLNQPGLVHFSAKVSEPNTFSAVEIDEVDANGNFLSKITDLYDTGNAAFNDLTARDGVFNGLSTILITSPGTRRFVAKLSDTAQKTLPLLITGVDPPSEQQLAADTADSDAANASAMQVLAKKGSPANALKAAKKVLQTSPNVLPASIITSPQSIQWTTADGILNLLDTSVLGANGSKGGTAISPASAIHPALLTTVDPSEFEGDTAIGIAPFAWQFEPSDEVDNIDNMLRDAGFTVTEFRNSSSADANVSVNTFRNLGQYDAIVISSHGGQLAGGGEATLTGQRVTASALLDNAWDLLTHRLVLMSVQGVNYFAVTPSFISAYSGSMDGTIVYNSSCFSLNDQQMANAYLGNGAAAYIGYSQSVKSGFAFNRGISVFSTLLQADHNTVGDIPGLDLLHDTSAPPAYFVHAGDLAATLPHGGLLKDNDLYINYNWPQTYRDLDSNTRFLGVSVGWNLSSSPYINWSGDNTSAGGTEVSLVNLYQAWKNAAWATTTSVSVGADWYTPAGGQGPAFITIGLKNKTSGKITHTSAFTVNPGQESTGAHTFLETVSVTLTGDPLNPIVHINIA